MSDGLFEMESGPDWATLVGADVTVMMSWGPEPAMLHRMTKLDGYPAAEVRLLNWSDSIATVDLGRLSRPATSPELPGP